MSNLGPQPNPVIEPGEPNPGGVDALPENHDHAVPDLSPEENPSLEDRAPDTVKREVREREDTSTEATRSDEGADEDPKKESPA